MDHILQFANVELPARVASAQKPARTRAEPKALELTPMPISFGVLLLALGVTALVCLTLSGFLYRNAATRSELARRSGERRLSHELTQLRASTAALEAQLGLRAQDIATQSRTIERMSAELERLRNRSGLDARGTRARHLARQ